MPRLEQLRALRAERFELMDQLAQLPSDMVFFTQITMEAAEDPAFLTAMRRANKPCRRLFTAGHCLRFSDQILPQ